MYFGLSSSYMPVILFILFIGAIAYFIYSTQKTRRDIGTSSIKEIENLLDTRIGFYQKISSADKKEIFKNRVINFIQHVRFTSAGNIKHTLSDEVLIATSAIIPLYNFPDWEYRNIREIILYDDHFDSNYKVDEDKHIMGMVGEGALNNTMLLSLRALREGYEKKDGSNTAIHEFVHLIDKADGVIDGVPEYLIPRQLVEPWLRHIHAAIQDIRFHQTEINPYAATNEAEFLAVIAEYFFEKPEQLSRNHPELYAILVKIFSNQSLLHT